MSKKKIIDQAIPVMPEGTKASIATTKIVSAYTLIAAMKGSPGWPAATGVQDATLAWETDTKALEANHQHIGDLLAELAAARANELTLLRRWGASKLGVTTAVRAYSDGSKDKVLSFHMSVAQKGPTLEATPVQELRGKRSKAQGEVGVAWKPQRAAHDYMVQHCTNPADPATYSTPTTCSKASFELTGQVPGATIHFRVVALDPNLPNGQTDYTPWVPVMVSSG